MNLRTAILGAALLAASPGLFAQATPDDRASKMRSARAEAEKACQGKAGPEHRECMRKQMCAQAKDPKSCEERLTKMKDAHQDARKACEGKTGAERDQCMASQMCSRAKNAERCQAEAKERTARREKIREACKDKSGADLKACIREQRGESRSQK
jgi:hypothetical protein